MGSVMSQFWQSQRATFILLQCGQTVSSSAFGGMIMGSVTSQQVLAVAAGTYHTCAMRTNGQLVCFGRNDYGQCDVPADLGPVLAVAAGTYHTCAIRADGQLVCLRCHSDVLVPPYCDVPADLGPVLAVAANRFHTCAIRADGQLVCFGVNVYGQRDVPADLGPVLAVTAGKLHTCAMRTNGQLVCFGE